MTFRKRTISIIIILVTISMLGLTLVQVSWLNKALTTNEQILNQKVDIALENIRLRFTNNEMMAKNVLYLKEHPTNDTVTQWFEAGMKNLIDSAFRDLSLDIDYEYGVFEHVESEQNEFVITNIRDGDFALITCGTSLTCSWSEADKYGSYHLALHFPNKEQYLFQQASSSLIATIGFILLLMGCFFYAIITIRRQKRLSEMKNDFINNLTHEFKTPIFSISLASKMLKNSVPVRDSEKLSKYTELIDNEGKRLKSQVDKVLQMALIDSGNFKLEKKRVNVHQLIEKVARSFELVVSERNGSLTLNLDGRNHYLHADETHLNNIIYNLLDNAQKYTEQKPDIVVSTEDAPEGLKISIKDNGIGMGSEVQKFIFDKFYRAESGNIHNVKGFGLGLSYVKSIVDAHRGWINLKSEINKGSEFTLHLPLA